MADAKDRRISGTVTLPMTTFDFLDAVGRERFSNNRSAAAEHYIELGRAAEAAGWRPAAHVLAEKRVEA